MTNSSFDLMATNKMLKKMDNDIPDLEQWNPEFCGDIDMRIARDGRWFYMGTPIGRPEMVKLFSRVLWQEDGKYFLKTPVEKVGIKVDDAPFLIISVEQQHTENGSELCFTTLTQDRIIANKDHPIWVNICPETGEPSPYIKVRFGMAGLINRNVFYELVDMAELQNIDGQDSLVIKSGKQQFKLGTV